MHRVSLSFLFLLVCTGLSLPAGAVTPAHRAVSSASTQHASHPHKGQEGHAPHKAEQGFARWRDQMVKKAIAKGISPKIVQETLGHTRFLPRVIELDRRQPEKVKTFAAYRDTILTADRINRGRTLLRDHAAELKQVEARTGVPAAVIVALWGIETNYGRNTGGFDVVEALATLAYDGRRAAYFERELMNALTILHAGHIKPADMKGSWAGAMGQNQFMPSSFLRLAVDGDGDGRKDIWTSLPDVFASSANYLQRAGWKKGQKWGTRVVLSTTFHLSDLGPIGLLHPHPVSFWESMGIRLINNNKLSDSMDPRTPAYLIQPGKTKGELYLVYDNYKTIYAWNQSPYFATTVGLLADVIELNR